MFYRRKISLASQILLFIVLSTAKLAAAQTITEIIDSTGDGAGNSLDHPLRLGTDTAGNIYVPGDLSSNVFKITPAGVISEIIDSTGDGGGNLLFRPRAVAIDASNNVFVSAETTDNVFKITSGGVITEIMDSSGDGGGNALDNAAGIAVDSAGNVYVASRNNHKVFKITPGGIKTQIIDSTGDGLGNTLASPTNVAIDSAGNVYVPDVDSVFKIAPGGAISEIMDSTGDGINAYNLGTGGIAVDGSNNVYVSAGLSNNVFKITPANVITEIIDATGDGAGNSLDRPEQITVDSSGNVYVAANDSHNAFKITAAGVISEIIDSSGDGAGNTLSVALGIAVDASGNVYVSGGDTDNVFKIAAPPAPVFTLPDPPRLRSSTIELTLGTTVHRRIRDGFVSFTVTSANPNIASGKIDGVADLFITAHATGSTVLTIRDLAGQVFEATVNVDASPEQELTFTLVLLNPEDDDGTGDLPLFRGGAKTPEEGSFFSDGVFSVGDLLEINFLITPAVEHIGEEAIIIVALVDDNNPEQVFLMSSEGAIEAYDGLALIPFRELVLEQDNIVSLTAEEPIVITADIVGQYSVYVAYQLLSTDELFFHEQAVQIQIVE